MKRLRDQHGADSSLPSASSSSSSCNNSATPSDKTDTKKRRTDGLSAEFPLKQSMLYFTPIGGITTEIVSSEGALQFSKFIEAVNPINSIHFTFEINFEWVISCYPSTIRNNPITLVVGDQDSTSLRRDAKEYSNVSVIAARLPIMYGTHHSKLTILENEHNVHVIVSTANLVTGDWEYKTQQFYHAYGKKTSEATSSPFQEDLITYLTYYGKSLDSWKSILRNVDFSEVKDRLIFSVPGYHKGDAIHKLGHMRLRSLLKEAHVPSVKQEEVSSNPSRPLFIAQCSSIGSLGKAPATWFRGEFLQSLEGATPAPFTAPARAYVIYPTIENVRQSCQGYEAGCSLPYRDETHKKQYWLTDYMCKWRSDGVGRTLAMPHCKSYVKIVDQKVQWQVVTSANLSKAAWGELQKNNTQLCIRSYEIGVLILDPERFKLPYDYPIVRYQAADKPWTTDNKHLEPDIFGQKWVHGS